MRLRVASNGRGRSAARIRETPARTGRQVVVKTRLVQLRSAGGRSTASHLRYIERDGTGARGEPGQAFAATGDKVDLQAFELRGRGDRHQFRVILAPEDAAELGDLRSFTRDFMARMEIDLGTRPDWVAVDHWDTGHPHVHIVLRGKDDSGHDLVIAREYIARGMRESAAALATEWLGPRTEREIHDATGRQVTQERWTGLDQRISRLAGDGNVELSSIARSPRGDRALLVGRLRHLETMGLASRVDKTTWSLRSDAQATLRALSERDDIVRRMQRALGPVRRELVVDNADSGKPVVGRILDRGLADEFGERGYLVVDGLDGRAHYARLPTADLNDFPVGGIVELASPQRSRHVDEAIARATRNGVFRTDQTADLSMVRDAPSSSATTSAVGQVRRLEVLRRAGLVKRLANGSWLVPDDLLDKAAAFDRRGAYGAEVRLRSHWSIDRQRRALGATWLDQCLVSSKSLGSQGFACDVAIALREREEFLIEHGFAQRRGSRVLFQANLLDRLRERDLATAGAELSAQLGRVYKPSANGQRVAGVYRQDVVLASGRFAVLDDGVGFSLVPWRPVLAQRLKQTLSATIQHGHADWDLRRSRGLAL